MPWYTGLARVARTTGFPVVETTGWKTNGHRAMTGCQAIIVHHTAAVNTTANAPTLNYVRKNKLSHFVLGRDGTIYVTGAGFQGHAGKDSLVAPAHARNATSIGIEAENNGRGEPWPAVQMESYVRLVRALIDEFGLPVSRVYGHKEIALTQAGRLGRKTDPTFNMNTFRTAVQRGYWKQPDATSRPSTAAPAKPDTPIPAPKPKEDTLSAAEVQEIKAHITASEDRIVEAVYDKIVRGTQWAQMDGEVPLKRVLSEIQEATTEALAVARTTSRTSAWVIDPETGQQVEVFLSGVLQRIDGKLTALVEAAEHSGDVAPDRVRTLAPAVKTVKEA